MPYQNLGSIIEKERKEENISQSRLANGLCTTQTLYDIETDRYDADFLLLEILLQRLGKSPDKLEIMMGTQSYGMIEYRDRIEEVIFKGDREAAEKLIEDYPAENDADCMYCFRMRAEMYYYAEHDALTAGRFAEKAVLVTLPGFTYEKMDEYLISTMEMENILAVLRMRMEVKSGAAERRKMRASLEKCRCYIDNHFADEEEHAKIYAKCVWLLAQDFYVCQEYAKVIELCTAGLEVLRNNTMIYFIFPLLSLGLKAERELGIRAEESKWASYERSLLLVWDNFAEAWYPKDSLFHNCCQREFHLDYERIRAERLARHMTQEELADGIYRNTASLSRVESGKAAPSKKMFEKLMRKLGIEKGRYNAYAVTDSFKTMELRQDIDRFTAREDYAGVERTLQQLREMLNLTIMENEQVIEDTEILVRTNLYKEISNQLLERRIRLVRDVLDYGKKEIKHIPTRNEILWLNHLCVELTHMDKEELANQIYLEILKKMNQSRVRKKFRYRSYSLILNNYVEHTREKNVEELKLELECGKASMICYAMINYVIFLEKEKKPEKYCLDWAEAVYYVSDLFYFPHIKQLYGTYLAENGRKIIF